MAGVLKGRTCTAYPGVMHDVLAAGAKWAEANETYLNAVTDGNLVTAPAWPAHPAWIRKFPELLGTKIEP